MVLALALILNASLYLQDQECPKVFVDLNQKIVSTHQNHPLSKLAEVIEGKIN